MDDTVTFPCVVQCVYNVVEAEQAWIHLNHLAVMACISPRMLKSTSTSPLHVLSGTSENHPNSQKIQLATH